MERQGGTLRSVNALRCALVLGLVAFQSLEVSESYGRVADTALWVVPGWTIAALCALAGFTGLRSVERNGAALAVARTALRFLPALAFVVVATAYGLGAVATTESRHAYLLDGDVAAYLLNLGGAARATLPGVFAFNAASGVINPIMAVVPAAYLATALLVAAARWPAWGTAIIGVAGATLAVTGVGLLIADVDLGRPDGLPAVMLAGQGLRALLGFLMGALLYRLRRAVPIDWRVAIPVAAGLVLIAVLGNRSWSGNALVGVLTTLPIAYLAIYASAWPWPLRHRAAIAEPVLWWMLLLSYPIQQLWIAFGPDRQNAVANFIRSFPLIMALASASWFLVERPLLRRFVPTIAPPIPRRPRERRFDARVTAERARAILPLIAVAVLVVAVILAALALTMFAMQRDPGGG